MTVLTLICVGLSSVFRQTTFVGGGARSSVATSSPIARPALVAADIPKHPLGLKTSATPLMKAAWRGDTKKLQDLLDRDEDINAQDEFGWTAIRYAIRNQQADAARLLSVDFKADVNLASNSGCTPLMSAARNNMKEMVKGLLNSGADVKAVDNEGLTALDYARVDEIKAMIDPTWVKPPAEKQNGKWAKAAKEPKISADIPIHRLGLESSATLLMKAAYEGDTQKLYAILSGAPGYPTDDINAQDEFGWTAMRYAVRNSQAAAARFLAVDFKADINLASKSGRTPLMSAAGNNLQEMVKGLVNCGADLTADDNEGFTAFDHARLDSIKAMVDPTSQMAPAAEEKASEPVESWEEVKEFA